MQHASAGFKRKKTGEKECNPGNVGKPDGTYSVKRCPDTEHGGGKHSDSHCDITTKRCDILFVNYSCVGVLSYVVFYGMACRLACFHVFAAPVLCPNSSHFHLYLPSQVLDEVIGNTAENLVHLDV